MGRTDPFLGYSLILRTILFGFVPAFAVFQFVRLRRALHVFQLEGYKRGRFLDWCVSNRARALFLGPSTAKKPLVMTGRAWRIAVLATVLSVAAVLVLSATAHLAGGAPLDILTWAGSTVASFLGAPLVLVAADWLLSPVQAAINRRYMRAARRRLEEAGPLVIGVTGSFGKTSTKFAIERLVGPPGTALATPGSYNTPLGVCRTINERLEPRHQALVVEMGAYGEGEIADLVAFARPSIGVLTSIGPAHLERFGSMDAIRRAKYEIVRDLPSGGVAVMNVDDPDVRSLADATTHVEVVRYGIDATGSPHVTALDVEVTDSGTRFRVVERDGSSIPVHTKLLGVHAIGHILAAVAVARVAGRSLEELAEPIRQLEPVEHRLQMLEGTGGITVIDDAYNSNPEGAAAALDVLGAMPGNKKLVVTPGMVELGPVQFEANERFGEHAARVADAVIVVARLNREAIVSGATRARNGARVITVDSLDQATEKLAQLLTPGDVVLFENDLSDQYEN
jgi:UDP-N-acetylmuramoyl-tripeptide--D-alanyl-D-alanine ligase